MATYLLTWNPSCWDISSMADELHATGQREDLWTTQSRKIRAGDTLLFLRQGVEPRGIVGLATATSAPVQHGRRWYAPLRWHWLEPEDPVISVADLQRDVPTGHWVPRCSGTRVSDIEAEVVLSLLDELRAEAHR
ncbi:MAG: hypothetical protein AAF170_08490 [Bacteroidota bacterium]